MNSPIFPFPIYLAQSTLPDPPYERRHMRDRYYYLIWVDLSDSTIYVYEGSTLFTSSRELIGGAPATPTDIGDTIVTLVDATYRSREHDVVMPYSVFFNNRGEAFHEGNVFNYSHGCIHLRRGFAHQLHDWALPIWRRSHNRGGSGPDIHVHIQR